MRLRILLVAMTFVLAVTRTAAANPSQDLDKARADFENGNYKAVVAELNAQIALLRDGEQLEAHRLLGMADFYLGHREDARREFTALLFADPNRTWFDPNIDTADVYAFFQSLKIELAGQLEEIRKQKAREEEQRKRPSKEVLVEKTYLMRSPSANFIPFGYGQFRNGDKGKGYFFLASETLTLGASATLFTLQASQYGIPISKVPSSDIHRVETFQWIQVGTGAAFLILYTWGVIDGFSNQTMEMQETRTERPLTPTSRLLIVPTVSPDGFGAAAMWSF